MIRYLTFLFFFFFCSFSFGQFIVRGKVADGLSKPLPYGNIQILDSTGVRIFAYTTTDDFGKYSLEIKKKGNYILKVSYLGFSAKKRNITINETITSVDFVLIPKADELKEVVINYDPKFAIVKKDTIIYDLRKVTNGQEKTLKDVLEKLPGIDINNQGKVTAFGSKVGKLLIDGEDIFKEQHQFATENITADMIAGVTFFKKYKGFANIDGFNNDRSTAINISIKEKYKQRITGNINFNGGVLNKYLLHTNLFRLGKKLKLTLLGDINNLGKESISFNDYIDLNTTVKSTRFGNTTSYDDNEIPTFLSSTRDIANRKIDFGAINFVYSPSTNLKISGYNIFNKTVQEQRFLNRRSFFEDLPDQNESRNIFGDFLFNTTQIKAAYKAGMNTFIQYTITNNPERDEERFDLSNNFDNTNNIFDQNIKNTNQNLGQELKITTKISNKSLLEFSGFTEFKKSNRRVFIEANRAFLGIDFLDNVFIVDQEVDKIKRTYGYTLNIRNKLGFGSLALGSGLIYNKQSIDTELLNLDISDFKNNLSLDFTDAFVNFKFSSKKIGIFSYNFDLGYHYFFYNRNNLETDSREAFFPNLDLIFRFNSQMFLSFNYSYKNEYPSLISGVRNDIVYNYFNRVNGGTLSFNEIFPTQRLGSTLSWTNFKTGSSILFSLEYADTSKSLTQNVTYQPDNYTENEYRFTDVNESFSALLDYNKNFRKSRIKFLSSTFFTLNNRGSFINTEENISTYTSIEQSFKISTNFKSNINYKLGVNLSYLAGTNSFNDIRFTSNTIDPYVGIRATFLEKRINFNFDVINKNFNAGAISRSFLVVNPSIKYTKPKSHWEFSITGNNMLNLESPEIVNNVNNNVFFEERISRSLEGYLIFGANYKF